MTAAQVSEELSTIEKQLQKFVDGFNTRHPPAEPPTSLKFINLCSNIRTAIYRLYFSFQLILDASGEIYFSLHLHHTLPQEHHTLLHYLKADLRLHLENLYGDKIRVTETSGPLLATIIP